MRKENNHKNLLAKARAIHFAMRLGSIPYEKAKELTNPLVELINKRITEIAQKHGVRAKLLKFQDLGRML